MKKIWFVCFLFFALPVLAEEDDCEKLPSCSELGYTMRVEECQGKSILRCPLEPTNDNAVFCADNE